MVKLINSLSDQKKSSDFQSLPNSCYRIPDACSNSEKVEVHDDFNEPVPFVLTDQGFFSRNILIFILSSYHSLVRVAFR